MQQELADESVARMHRGRQLKAAIVLAGIKQYEVARKLGVTEQYLSLALRGRVADAAFLDRVAVAIEEIAALA